MVQRVSTDSALKSINERIAAEQRRFRKIDEGIDRARQMRDHDPWKYDRERQQLALERSVCVQQLNQLTFLRRQAGGNSDAWKPAPSSYFTGHNYLRD